MIFQADWKCHIVRFYEKNYFPRFDGAGGVGPTRIPADGVSIYSHGD
jgi:hypothetical protein